MIRRFVLSAAVALFGAVTLAASFNDVTYVMKNGDRVSGTFSYNHTDHFQVIVNGRERDFPAYDVAFLEFGGGDPTAEEVNKLPASADPPELERHTLVLRSGEMIRGKIWDFQGDKIFMDVAPNDRRSWSMNDTLRLYISAPGSRALFANANANSAVNGARARGQGRGLGLGRSITIDLAAAACWADTGINVVQNQAIAFSSTGQITLSGDRNDIATAAGSTTGRYAQNAPIPNNLLGALIGRIDNHPAFGIGNQTQELTMPQAGRLWIGINDGTCGDNTGAYRVTIRQ